MARDPKEPSNASSCDDRNRNTFENWLAGYERQLNQVAQCSSGTGEELAGEPARRGAQIPSGKSE